MQTPASIVQYLSFFPFMYFSLSSLEFVVRLWSFSILVLPLRKWMHFIVSRSCSFSYVIPSLLIALSWFSRFFLRKVLWKEVCCLSRVFSNPSLNSQLVGEFMCLFVCEFTFFHVVILRESLFAFIYVIARLEARDHR